MLLPLITLTAALSAPKADAPPRPERSAVCVRYEFAEGGLRKANLGSGTVVACEGGWSLVLTNHHVCPEAGKAARVGHEWRRYDAWVACADPAVDLAALMVRAEMPAAKIARDRPKADAELWQYGFGLSLPCRKSGRATDDYRDEQGRPTHFTTVKTESGDSGSGLFDAKGHLVGVTWGSGGAAIQLEPVRRFAERVARESKVFPKLAAELK